ncbi:unnamed protein product [Mytilus edulis]|uniref:Uncharacterized protein n=1 Tax=Mytilus edulis TaxID=6550 RepID=A0A8S3U2P7_MYTED|nr:unnamed protein product [Mytilus edulis]
MLMKYFNDTKFCLLPEVVNSHTENLDNASFEDKDQSFILENQQKIKRILEYDSEEIEISSSIACRNALFPPVSKDERGASSNRCPSWAAEKFLKDISSLGFGEVEQKSHSLNKSSSLVFRKRKFEELSEPHIELIKKLKISNEKYINGTRG